MEGAMAARKRNPSAVEAHPLNSQNIVNVTLEWEPETRFYVTTVRELNGISTFGRTEEEALDKTAEMILGYLETCFQLNRRPGSITKAKAERLRALLLAA
jgi:predicted RNase H-like HicB family nuclease